MSFNRITLNMNDVCGFSRDHVVEFLKEQFCLVLNQFVYVVDVLGDSSGIIWQRVKSSEKWNFCPQGDSRSGP